MPVMSPSLCIGAQPLVFLPSPRSSPFLTNGNFRGRYYPTRVSMQLQNPRTYPSLKAVGTGASVRKGFGFSSKSKRSLFVCNAAVLTQTVTRESRTITKAPTHGTAKSPKLDDGGNGFPPRYGGGGGGGGGGGESFSGGFFLFGLLMFMAYLKDLESET